MLAIKLQRMGKLHQPSYRVVVAEKRSKLGAPPVEDLGHYDPFTKIATLKKDRITYWLGVGAEPTDTAHNLLVKEKVLDAPKKTIKLKIKKAEEKTETAPPAPAAEAPATAK